MPQFSRAVLTEIVTLETGDYSAKFVSDVVQIERKSATDFVACCTSERPRFIEQWNGSRSTRSRRW
jgi:ERCC4-type nuclease